MGWGRRLKTLCTAILMGALFGCGGSASGTKPPGASQQQLTKACVLPNGKQDSSLQGHWLNASLPIKLSFHNGSNWSGPELNALMAGANAWNAFFQYSKGSGILSYGSSSSPNSSSTNVSKPDCLQTASPDGTVIYKRGTWTGSSDVMAVTSFCIKKIPGEAIPVMFNAIIEVNYDGFFVDKSRKYPDLQSIITHELGHLVGLDHTCGALRSGLPNLNCPGNGNEEEIPGVLNAIMLPTFGVDANTGKGEVRRILTVNDQGRANCLY